MADVTKESFLILVVDDNTEAVKILTDILSKENYKVHVALSGSQAIESIKGEIPDLVLLDIQLPDISGYEVCRIIKKDEKTSHIPVIFVSALTEGLNKVEAFKAGAVDYLTKPVYVDEVLMRIKTHLEIVNYQRKLHQVNYKLYQQLISTFEQAAVGIAHISVKTNKIIKANNRLCSMLGYDKDEIIEIPFSEIIHPEYQSAENDNIKDLLNDLINSYVNEFTVKCRNDSLLWVRRTVSVVKDADDKPEYFVNIIEDVTKQKEIEFKLTKSEKRLKQAQEMAKLGNWEYNFDPNKLYFSDETFAILGIDPLNFKGTFQEFLSVIHHEDMNKVIVAYEDHLENNVPFDIEHRVLLKNGDVKYVHLFSKSKFNDKGEAVKSIGTVQDITDKKLIEMQILKLNEELEDRVIRRTREIKKLSQAVEQSPLSVIITEKDGTIVYANKTFSIQSGYSNEEIIGEKPSKFKAGVTEVEVYENLWNTILSGKTWSGELLNKKKNGDFHWVFASISPIFNDENEIINFVEVKEDITERKKMEHELKVAKENAESATRAKSDFVANMSHEIRTPMNAIIGLTHLLSRTDLDSKQDEYINKIDNSAKNLLRIINDILDFSKIEAGKLNIEELEFNLNDVLENISSIINDKAQKKGIEFIIAVNRDVPINLIGDPLRIGQVLLNLANNAVKFTDNGEIIIRIEVKSIVGDDIVLKLSVADTGIGLKEDEKNKLFKAFSQADSSTTRKYGGTGLGLSISKKLTEIMGGSIGVESEYGIGSTFYFTINCKLIEKKDKRLTAFPDRIGQLRVLVVDDNESARNVLSSYLNDFDCEVTAVSSGHEAVSHFLMSNGQKNKPYHLILMDYKMPGLNGIETIEEIKKLRKLYQPKIILVTAYGREEILISANEAHVDGILIKPITQSVLYDTIVSIFINSPVNNKEVKMSSFDVNVNRVLSGNILLVEDNEINQEIVIEICKEKGLEIDVAWNGSEAIEKIKQKSYDLVLMDLQMPVMDGFTATKLIRRNFSYDRLPIIAMTADAMIGVKDKVRNSQMNDYLTKPIDPEKIFHVLDHWLPGKNIQPVLFNEKSIYNISIPVIDNLSAGKGISRLNGNVQAYVKLIKKFRNNNINTNKEVKKLIGKKKYDECEKIIHAVKGVSGNISADSLYEISIRFDAALVEKNEEKIIKLEKDFEYEMNRVLNSIKRFEKKNGKNEIPQADSKKVCEIENELKTIYPKLTELKKYLSKNNMRSVEVLSDILLHVTNEEIISELNRIYDKLENYDFDKSMQYFNNFYEKYYRDVKNIS